jgi:hypothetical protein
VEGTDNLSNPIDIGLTKVCTTVRALCIKDVAGFANPEDCQAPLPSSELFYFAFRECLEDFLLAAAKLKGVHGELRCVFS